MWVVRFVLSDSSLTSAGDCPQPRNECDYEVNRCGWEDDETADYIWGRTIAEGSGEYHRITKDHTTGTGKGHYLHNYSYLYKVAGTLLTCATRC